MSKTTKKRVKYDSERREDVLKVGDPVWVLGQDVYEAIVTTVDETREIAGRTYTPAFYGVRDARHSDTRPSVETREYRTDLYRRPAELEELIEAVETNRDNLSKQLEKLSDQLYELENEERCQVCGQPQSARLTACWACRG
jgi:predicted RNase H-like nuclease (RuvC/YqgF family)